LDWGKSTYIDNSSIWNDHIGLVPDGQSIKVNNAGQRISCSSIRIVVNQEIAIGLGGGLGEDGSRATILATSSTIS
jgi:hypothetical protein